MWPPELCTERSDKAQQGHLKTASERHVRYTLLLAPCLGCPCLCGGELAVGMTFAGDN